MPVKIYEFEHLAFHGDRCQDAENSMKMRNGENGGKSVPFKLITGKVNMAYIQRLAAAMLLAGILLNLQFADLILNGSKFFDSGPAVVSAAENEPNIKWFKDQMKISEKYVEQGEGVLGMSWTHFLTMVVLLLFAAWALAAFILRYKRTQKVLDEIRKEK